MPPVARRAVLTAGGLLVTGGAVAGLAASVDSPRQALTGAGLATGNEAARAQDASRREVFPVGGANLPPAHQRGTAGQGATGRAVFRDEPRYYIDDGVGAIALTIDDGPSPVYTPQVLEILESYHVTASFSMVGRCVARYPSIAREVAQAGHLIVNHTWDHRDIGLMPARLVRDEIGRASDVIHAATGQRPRWFRAPYGAWSADVFRYCAGSNLRPLDWSVDPEDWALPGTASIVRNILLNTRTGSIILEHDGGGNRSQTVAALSIVIPRLLDAGYRFRTP